MNIQPKTLDAFEAAEEMALLVAGEFVDEILEPDEAELQTRWRELHPAQGKENGIESRENRKDQNERDGRCNKESARMAVEPFRPAFAVESPAGEIPRLAICRRCESFSDATYLAGTKCQGLGLDLRIAAEVVRDLVPAGFDILQRFIDRDFASEIAGEFACRARRPYTAGHPGSSCPKPCWGCSGPR